MNDPHIPASSLSKSETARQWIRERIRTRDYEPGHRLVLSTIAAQLGISVVPVREAIRQLEAEGLVSFELNVGARVTELNRQVYYETMETAAVLEGRATGLAVPHLDADDLFRAREINVRMELLLEDFKPELFTKLNQEFHRCLFDRCPNERLKELVEAEWDRLDHFRVSSFRYIPGRAAASVAEHRRLTDLIEAGADTDYIEIQAREHRLTTAASYRAQVGDTDPGVGTHDADTHNTDSTVHNTQEKS